ncbi:MAG: RNA pseudouridine synthase [Parachlamydiaceae bacterium]|nr:RNA pseudouridine synthase [Parachlamydiaceae bacterium]
MVSILFEDNHQVVVNKPAGLLTQPSGTNQDSLEAQVKQWIKEHYNKPGNVFLEAVHRIDKPVSGIVLFARTSKGLSRLQESMREKKSKKIYLALIEGVLGNPNGTLEHYLVHDDFQARIAPKTDSAAKLARLHYRVLKQAGQCCLVEIELETGRYHQIRVQFAAIGHPIRGDVKYGSRFAESEEHIFLHHSRLQIPHPITGELQQFEAPLPDYWSA